MNKEDKKIIADYMDWVIPEICFNLNDAGLVVEEMVKCGEWEDFVVFVEETPENRELLISWNQLIAWLFNADNFFKAFVEWRKSL